MSNPNKVFNFFKILRNLVKCVNLWSVNLWETTVCERIKIKKCSTAYFLKLVSPGETQWDYPKLMPVVEIKSSSVLALI